MSWPTSDVRTTGDRLRAGRRPFVVATVVRAERPTSAKAGDTALVLDDGTLVGFVGGDCAQSTVQVHALATLERGEPLLLRISPDMPPDSTATPNGSGAVTVHNPCLSGGTLEIFLEPVKPATLVVIHGDAPIAGAVRELATCLGYDTQAWSAEGIPPDADAVVVASHGGDEGPVLTAALAAGVPYIGLVASPRRGKGVLDSLALSEGDRERIRTPAGLDIGSQTPKEVALSILAEMVARRTREPRETRSQKHEAEAASTGGPMAIDPVCGMTVAAISANGHAYHEGIHYWFCGSGCVNAFRADPEKYLLH
jgi:xanthine dehydrogenase accessory factor